MSNAPMKPRILSLLEFARQQEQRMVNSLSDAERNAKGTLDSWASFPENSSRSHASGLL